MEHSPVHSFTYGIWLLLHYNSKVGSCNRDHMACKAENIYYLGLYRKSLQTLDLEKLGLRISGRREKVIKETVRLTAHQSGICNELREEGHQRSQLIHFLNSI